MSFKDYSTIKIDQGGPVAWVILNRPEIRNAFNNVMISEIAEAFRAINQQATGGMLPEAEGRGKHVNDLRVVVVTGEGNAFCAGAEGVAFTGDNHDAEIIHMLSSAFGLGKHATRRLLVYGAEGLGDLGDHDIIECVADLRAVEDNPGDRPALVNLDCGVIFERHFFLLIAGASGSGAAPEEPPIILSLYACHMLVRPQRIIVTAFHCRVSRPNGLGTRPTC